jgi:PAS domain S-box-containing protein
VKKQLSSVNQDIDTILASMSSMIADTCGKAFLDLYTRAITQLCNITSCCIYEINHRQGLVDAMPLSISSAKYTELLNKTAPGHILTGLVLSDGLYQQNEAHHPIFEQDELLDLHKAHAVLGFPVNDIEGQPLGMVMYISDCDHIMLDVISEISKHYAGRISAELERLMLRKQLNKTRTDFRYLVETSRDMIWEMDLYGRFVEVNRSAIMIYGYYPDEMKGMHYSRLMTSDAAIEYDSYLQRSIQGNGIYDIVANHINKNGRPIQVIYNAKPKYSVTGELQGYTGTTTDITESVRAQIAIKNNSELFSAILSRLPVVFFRIDENGYLVDIRGQGLKRMGVDDMAWVGRPGYGLFVGMDEMINDALSGKTAHFRSSGSYQGETWWFYTSMFFDSWTGFGAVGFALDITDQMESEEKLVHLLKDNRELAQRLVEVQEEERRNLSRELHDELGQSITAVKSLAIAITAAAGDSYSEIRSLGNSIVDLSGRLYDVVNGLMHRLRPDILDSLGFEATINSCISNSQLERTGVKCNLDIIGDIDDLDEVVQITVYRIIQECLTNISKYAMASNIDIVIERKMSEEDELQAGAKPANLLIIKVSDDGVGMDAEVDTQSTQEEARMGLQGMKERVTALGGELFIVSSPGSGVKIEAIIDLNNRPGRPNGCGKGERDSGIHPLIH